MLTTAVTVLSAAAPDSVARMLTRAPGWAGAAVEEVGAADAAVHEPIGTTVPGQLSVEVFQATPEHAVRVTAGSSSRPPPVTTTA